MKITTRGDKDRISGIQVPTKKPTPPSQPCLSRKESCAEGVPGMFPINTELSRGKRGGGGEARKTKNQKTGGKSRKAKNPKTDGRIQLQRKKSKESYKGKKKPKKKTKRQREKRLKGGGGEEKDILRLVLG